MPMVQHCAIRCLKSINSGPDEMRYEIGLKQKGEEMDDQLEMGKMS